MWERKMDKLIQYNIALLAENPLPFQKVANDLFLDVSDGYLLSDNSLTHITICQFVTDNQTIPEKIFKDVQTLNIKHYNPKMLGFSFQKGPKKHEGFYMAQIFIEREPALMTIHNRTLDILRDFGINCLNDHAELYKPHITLARIKLIKPIPIWHDSILNSARFKLTLGLSDQNGQYLQKVSE